MKTKPFPVIIDPTVTVSERLMPRIRAERSRYPVHPVLTGDRKYLRALRAAETVAWEAGLPVEAAVHLISSNPSNTIN